MSTFIEEFAKVIRDDANFLYVLLEHELPVALDIIRSGEVHNMRAFEAKLEKIGVLDKFTDLMNLAMNTPSHESRDVFVWLDLYLIDSETEY